MSGPDLAPGLAPTLGDYERLAARRLPPGVAAFLFGGAGEETTMAANRAAFAAWPLVPRLLRRPPAEGIELFGRRFAAPLLVAPVGYQTLFHPEGERASAQAAAAFGIGFVTSHLSTVAMEEIAAAGQGAPQWQKLYWRGGLEPTLRLARRAAACGVSALVLTLDAPVDGPRDRQTRAGFAPPVGARLPHLAPAFETPTPPADEEDPLGRALAGAPDWRDVAALAAAAPLPLLAKGVQHPDDARAELAAGCAGVIVSNHGGRVLDGAIGALDALPGVVAAVAGRTPVLFDSGVRRGVDVAKALSAGADAVLLGRPVMAALAVGGARGVAHALRLFIDETRIARALS